MREHDSISAIKKNFLYDSLLIDRNGFLIAHADSLTCYGILTFYDKDPDLFVVKSLKARLEDGCSFF